MPKLTYLIGERSMTIFVTGWNFMNFLLKRKEDKHEFVMNSFED